MYIELSYAQLRELFTDTEVTAVSVDIILSVQKKLQINAQDLYGAIFFSVEAKTVGETTYYIHRLTITRAYFEALTNEDNLKLRYTYDKDISGTTIYSASSSFLYVDNLTVCKDVITVDEVITKESIESTTDITLDLATLVEGEITALYVNNRLTAIPQDNRLVIAAKDYTVGTKYTVRICIEGKIVVQPFTFKELKLPTEQDLIVSFYKTTDTKQTLTKIEDFMSAGNSAYGIAEIKSNNSSTMYIELSYEHLAALFTDAKVTEVKLDIILSVQKKLQINAKDLPDTVSYSVAQGSIDGKDCYIYTLTITRAYFEGLTNKNNLKLRYTHNGKDENGQTIFGGNSEFMYLDNLQTVKVEQ